MSSGRKKIDYSKCHFGFHEPSEEKKKFAEMIEKGDTENLLVINLYPDGSCKVVT